MKYRLTSMLRKLLPVLAVLIVTVGATGCKFTVAGKPMRVLVTTRVPGRTVDHGQGEKIRMEPLDPSGDTFFVVIRTND